MNHIRNNTVEERLSAFTEMYVKLQKSTSEKIPSRRHLSLRRVASFAADMAIIELVSDDKWIVRLSGTNHCSRANIDRTGQNVLASLKGRERTERLEMAKNLFSYPCGAKTRWEEKLGNGMRAKTVSVSFPSFGKNGELFIISYVLLDGEMEWERREEASSLESISLLKPEYFDIGYGAPA